MLKNAKRLLWLIALTACLALGGRLTATAADQQPNVLFVFADDQCFETVRAFGSTGIETPNLDKLVRAGTTFTRAYNMGSWSGAVCIASRTMLNTGRFLWQANRVYRTTEQERQAGRFWSEYMKRAGYDTYFTGKWHVRADPLKAFDFVDHVRGGMPNQTEAGYNRPIEGQADRWKPWDRQFEGFWKGGKHWSEVVADDAVAFIGQAAKRPKPFFMYLAFNAPHDPRQSPQQYVDRYPLKRIQTPRNYAAEYPYKEDIGAGRRLRDERLAPFPRTEHAVKVNRQEYYAIITHMDAQIGRILDALDRSGKARDTYIFFTADHGLAVGHHGLMGKQNMYDHSVRVPFLVTGPGIPTGKQIDVPIYLQDVMPTTLELAGVAKPEHVQFNSLMPLIRGQAQGHYQAVYGAYLELQRMVIEGDYKLILYPRAARARLYHLGHDPHEMHDLAGEPGYTKVLKRLFARLLMLQAETGDDLDLESSFPNLL